MMALGIVFLFFGYGALYTGLANMRNGQQGPTYAEAIGFKELVAPPGAEKPNLTGQPAVPR